MKFLILSAAVVAAVSGFDLASMSMSQGVCIDLSIEGQLIGGVELTAKLETAQTTCAEAELDSSLTDLISLTEGEDPENVDGIWAWVSQTLCESKSLMWGDFLLGSIDYEAIKVALLPAYSLLASSQMS